MLSPEQLDASIAAYAAAHPLRGRSSGPPKTLAERAEPRCRKPRADHHLEFGKAGYRLSRPNGVAGEVMVCKPGAVSQLPCMLPQQQALGAFLLGIPGAVSAPGATAGHLRALWGYVERVQFQSGQAREQRPAPELPACLRELALGCGQELPQEGETWMATSASAFATAPLLLVTFRRAPADGGIWPFLVQLGNGPPRRAMAIPPLLAEEQTKPPPRGDMTRWFLRLEGDRFPRVMVPPTRRARRRG